MYLLLRIKDYQAIDLIDFLEIKGYDIEILDFIGASFNGKNNKAIFSIFITAIISTNTIFGR